MTNSEPPTITITLPITAHRSGPLWQVGEYAVRAAIMDIIEIPPGQPFQIEEQEGRRLVRRFGGRIVSEH